jgi:PPOX class probable F420-dependent enzyme
MELWRMAPTGMPHIVPGVAFARMLPMKLTSHLPDERRAHVEARLRANLMAWLTTVRPDGRPDSVPVWFLMRDDETILIYSEQGKIKLRNISHNPRVALGLDVTDLGRDIIRIDGTAEHVPGFPPADQVPEYTVKYAERIGAMFGTASQFAGQFPEALIITPKRLHA